MLNLLTSIYVSGVIFNMVVFAFYFISNYETLQVNKKGTLLFVLASWLMPIIYILDLIKN